MQTSLDIFAYITIYLCILFWNPESLIVEQESCAHSVHI